MVVSLSDIKAQQRKKAFAARKLAHVPDDGRGSLNLVKVFLDRPEQIIAAYMPIRTEINPLIAMNTLHSAGRRICVPVIVAKGEPLIFREWTPAADMIEGPFGAKIPAFGDLLIPQALVVPLVAFDKTGNRLGYGGGFYDRTLEGLRAKAPTYAVGFAYSAQEMPLTPEITDQPMDLFVTEKGHFTPA